jgi:hypothetical protein
MRVHQRIARKAAHLVVSATPTWTAVNQKFASKMVVDSENVSTAARNSSVDRTRSASLRSTNRAASVSTVATEAVLMISIRAVKLKNVCSSRAVARQSLVVKTKSAKLTMKRDQYATAMIFTFGIRSLRCARNLHCQIAQTTASVLKPIPADPTASESSNAFQCVQNSTAPKTRFASPKIITASAPVFQASGVTSTTD